MRLFCSVLINFKTGRTASISRLRRTGPQNIVRYRNYFQQPTIRDNQQPPRFYRLEPQRPRCGAPASRKPRSPKPENTACYGRKINFGIRMQGRRLRRAGSKVHGGRPALQPSCFHAIGFNHRRRRTHRMKVIEIMNESIDQAPNGGRVGPSDSNSAL